MSCDKVIKQNYMYVLTALVRSLFCDLASGCTSGNQVKGKINCPTPRCRPLCKYYEMREVMKHGQVFNKGNLSKSSSQKWDPYVSRISAGAVIKQF